MRSHYSIIIIIYCAHSALRQLLNFHSQRHRFRRRGGCRSPLVNCDCCFAVTNEASTTHIDSRLLWRITLISFEFTFDTTTNCFFFPSHSPQFLTCAPMVRCAGAMFAHTLCTWKTFVAGSNFNSHFIYFFLASHVTWAYYENHSSPQPIQVKSP